MLLLLATHCMNFGLYEHHPGWKPLQGSATTPTGLSKPASTTNSPKTWSSVCHSRNSSLPFFPFEAAILIRPTKSSADRDLATVRKDDRLFSPFFGGGFPPFSICVRYVLVCSNIFIICVYQPSIWWRNPQKVLCKESYCYGRYAVRYALIYFDIYWAKYQHIHRYAPSRKHQAALYVCVHIVFILVESSILLHILAYWKAY